MKSSMRGRADLASLSVDYLLGSPAVEMGKYFADSNLGYALIGGQAVNCWTVPRVTNDYDFVVLADRDAIETVEALLARLGFQYLRRQDSDEPSGPDFVRMELPGRAIIVDLQAAKTEFQEAIVARAATTPGLGTRIATPEDLLVLKLIASRSKDNDDAHRLGSIPDLDWKYVESRSMEWQVSDRLARLRASLAGPTGPP